MCVVCLGVCVCVCVCARARAVCELIVDNTRFTSVSRLFRLFLSSYTHRFVVKNLYVSPADVLYVRFVRCSPGNAWFRDRGIRHLVLL